MIIEDRLISSLKPYDKNAKTHPKKQVDLLAQNIEKFGFTTPVLIDEHDSVIAGHGRLLAMKQLKRDTVPCVKIEGLTESEVKALRLADNKIAELGEWDMDLAIAELKGLSEDELMLTGFDKDLIIEPDENDDEIPENVKAQSEVGDLYELGKHRLLCGDSAKVDDMERLMDGRKADMVFTDPPWNVDYGNTPKDNAQGYKPRTIINDNMGEDFIPFLNSVFAMTAAFSKGGAPTYVVMSAQ